VNWTAYFAFPASYSKKKRAGLVGQVHRVKPDRDNVDKGLLDALFQDDSCVALGRLEKFWDDGHGARMVVEVFES
jgi:Holliday junction resolvase RusA-like endonuclease